MSFKRLTHSSLRRWGLGALAVLTVAPSPAAANVEIGVTAGPHIFSEDNELGVEDREDATSLRNSVLFGIRLATFTDMLGVEAEVGGIPAESRSLVFDIWNVTYRAHLIAQFRASKPENKLVPSPSSSAAARSPCCRATTSW